MTREKAKEILNNYNGVMNYFKMLLTNYADGAEIEFYTSNNVWERQDSPSFLLNRSYRVMANVNPVNDPLVKSETDVVTEPLYESILDFDRIRLLRIRWIYSKKNNSYMLIDVIKEDGVGTRIGFIPYKNLVENYKLYDSNLNEVKI